MNTCSVCLDTSEEKLLRCSKNHGIDSICLIGQLNSTDIASAKDANEIQVAGIKCFGAQNKCKAKYKLDDIQLYLSNNREGMASLSNFKKKVQSAMDSSSLPSPMSMHIQSVRHFRDDLNDCFNLRCPDCEDVLFQIEGCNAGSCERCKNSFCYLCLELQKDSMRAHEHADKHSGDFWEYRDGHTGSVRKPYTEIKRVKRVKQGLFGHRVEEIPFKYTARYHWLLAREKIRLEFSKADIDLSVKKAAVYSLRRTLKESKMWPMPEMMDVTEWIRRVVDSKILEQHNKVTLLQNEFIFWYAKLIEECRASQSFMARFDLWFANLWVKSHAIQKPDLQNKVNLIHKSIRDLGSKTLTSLDVRTPTYNDGGMLCDGEPLKKHQPELWIRPITRSDPNWFRLRSRDPNSAYHTVIDPEHKINSFILGPIQPNKIKLSEAAGQAIQTIPSADEWRAYSRAAGRNNLGGYKATVIADMSGNIFCSSTVDGAGKATIFNGSSGYAYSVDSNTYASVRYKA